MKVSQRAASTVFSRLVAVHTSMWSLNTKKASSGSPAAILHDYAGSKAASRRFLRTLRRGSRAEWPNTPSMATRRTAQLFAHAGMGLGAMMARPLDAALGTGRAYHHGHAEAPTHRIAQALAATGNYALDVGVLGAVGAALSASCAAAGAGIAVAIGVIVGAIIAACKKNVTQSREHTISQTIETSAQIGATIGLVVSLAPLGAVRLGVEGARLLGGLVKLSIGGTFAVVAGAIGCAAGLGVGSWVYLAQRQSAARAAAAPMRTSVLRGHANPWHGLAPSPKPSSPSHSPANPPSDGAGVSPATAEPEPHDTFVDWSEVHQAIAHGRQSGTLAPLPSSYDSPPPSPSLKASMPVLGVDDDIQALWNAV